MNDVYGFVNRSGTIVVGAALLGISGWFLVRDGSPLFSLIQGYEQGY